MPFSLPVLRKADVLPVRGRVYDSETGDGLRNVLLHLEGLTAATNGKGEFEFPAVRKGQYRLAMDRRNIAVDRIPSASSPSTSRWRDARPHRCRLLWSGP